MDNGTDPLDSFRHDLLGLPVAHVWRGHGSALFVEFGQLTPHLNRDGAPYNPGGEFGLMIEGGWRIEGASEIVCGSWSEEELWEPAFQDLIGRTVEGLTTFGRLPEITVALSGDMQLSSFMTSDGQPEWALFDRRSSDVRTIHSRKGQVCEEN